MTAVICLGGIVLNAFNPGEAFEIVLHDAALGIIASWAMIVLCQLRFYKRTQAGTLKRPGFRMPFTPYSGYVTLVFLVGIVVLMAFDEPAGTSTVAALVVIIPALIGGWFLVRNRVAATTARW